MDKPRMWLVVEAGPSPGQRFDLNQETVVIGRESNADVVIISPAVSRRHLSLSYRDSRWLLEDLGSSNGTYLNGERLNEPAALSPGDRVGLGRSIVLVLEVERVGESTRVNVEHLPAVSGQTTIGDALSLNAGPPRLIVTIAGGSPKEIPLTKPRYQLGRAEENDIVIPSPIVSRRLATIEQTGAGYRLEVMPEIANPLYLDGRPLQGSRLLRHGDRLRIGSQDPGVMVSLEFQTAEVEEAPPQAVAIGASDLLTIGRDPGNDVQLNSPLVSRFHAQIERVGQRLRIVDLRSANGTFVNDKRIDSEAWLHPDDTVRISGQRFVVGREGLARFDESGGLRVEVIGLNKWVRKDLNLLKDISLLFQPREFVVVVGQSGGGKSTLVDAVAGYRPATDGQVRVNGIDVYRNFDAIRGEIGFVPQKDIIHMELTVYQALDYAARLRMPADTTPAERKERVMQVLQDLDLVHRKDVQISGLSGGQQKRVSIGVELLTQPGLFFLDEPSSGLDPGTETALMQLMRRLADQGRTIVLITHATKNVMLADRVVFLARGGYLVWFGPPEEALEYFNQFRSARDQAARRMEFDEIYAILDDSSRGSAEDWARRFRDHPAHKRYITEPLAAIQTAKAPGSEAKSQTDPVAETAPMRTVANRDPAGAARAPASDLPAQPNARSRPRRRQISGLRQFFILSSRNLKILTRDRSSLVLMLAVAPLIGLLDVLLSKLLGRNPFDEVNGRMDNVTITLFLLAVYGVMVGGIAFMREFVKEGDIYRRERLVNLNVVPYVLSKVWLVVLVGLYHAAAFTLIRFLAFDMPGGPLEMLYVYISLALATMSGMMLGLFASALAPNANTAPMIVILLMLPQMVLGGALVEVPGSISSLTATRWAFQGFMAISGVGSDVAADACWLLPADLRGAMTIEDKRYFNCRCLGTSVLDENSCRFPGVGAFYDPVIEQNQPNAPAPLDPPPPEPELPPQPEEPANQADSVAVAEYLTTLKAYQTQVETIQTEYKTQLDAYQAKAEVFKEQNIQFQRDLASWQIARNAAVGKAEGVINAMYGKYSWTFVDKNDAQHYWDVLVHTWLAQGAIMGVLLVAITLLMMRKGKA